MQVEEKVKRENSPCDSTDLGYYCCNKQGYHPQVLWLERREEKVVLSLRNLFFLVLGGRRGFL